LGDVQAVNAAPSSEQAKVEPGSLDEKANEAELELTRPDGPESIVVSGGVVSGSASVVKNQTLSAASALPTTSLTPLSPPVTVAV
jgi:hypothetical protein